MLPISAIVGISTVGYLLDQAFRENEFNENNEENPIPVNNINGCAEQYPWNFVESFDDISESYNNENNSFVNENNSFVNENNSFVPNNKIPSDNIPNPLYPNPLTPEYINSPNQINAINNAGNPSPEYFINANERPVNDFLVNNNVPFFSGSGTNQDMRGTGVAQGNINSDDFNLGNGDKSAFQRNLDDFTGLSDLYLHKRETPAFFSPLEQRDRFTIPGEDVSAQRPLRDRYTTSLLTKNDEAPFERIQVGPGINVDENLPTDGQGFNSGLTTKIRPSNINAYRLTQLPGRVAGTKYQASNLPTALPGSGPSFKSFQNSKSNGNVWENENGEIDSEKIINEGSLYGVPNKKGTPLSTLLTSDRRPTTATPAVTQAPMHYSNYILPSATNRRTVTNVEFGQSIEIK